MLENFVGLETGGGFGIPGGVLGKLGTFGLLAPSEDWVLVVVVAAGAG